MIIREAVDTTCRAGTLGRTRRRTLAEASSHRYLQNGNILAARTFLSQLISHFTAKRSDFISSLHPSPIPVGNSTGGSPDEIVLTSDSVVNFCQLAVRTCQRAQGDKNKPMREAWVRLCGTYQSKGGLLAAQEVRRVRNFQRISSLQLAWFLDPEFK